MTSTPSAGTRARFNSTFWTANTLELFERLAFYGSKGVLAVFLADKVGLSNGSTLAGIFTALVFGLPIIGGVFVDKYGFRRTLMACFLIFCLGYFMIGLAGFDFSQGLVNTIGKKAYVLTALVFTSLGGSLIKPCIVGTVAKTTTPENKALGFSIYYMLVNIGGAAGPLLALTVRLNVGIEYVLMMSSATSAMLFLGTFLFFKEPGVAADAPDEKRTFGKVLGDMLLVFGNIRFISFLVIFSGFWIMFWQIFLSFPFYVTKVLHYERFEVFESIDAIGIIVLTVPITALVRKWRPFTAMTFGMVFASLCYLLIGMFGTLTAAVVGIGVYSIGEATQSPRFYEYVSNLAPREQVGTFMGFAFLPPALGAFFGGVLADYLKQHYLDTNPSMMWYITASVGVMATILMIAYNYVFAPSSKDGQN